MQEAPSIELGAASGSLALTEPCGGDDSSAAAVGLGSARDDSATLPDVVAIAEASESAARTPITTETCAGSVTSGVSSSPSAAHPCESAPLTAVSSALCTPHKSMPGCDAASPAKLHDLYCAAEAAQTPADISAFSLAASSQPPPDHQLLAAAQALVENLGAGACASNSSADAAEAAAIVAAAVAAATANVNASTTTPKNQHPCPATCDVTGTAKSEHLEAACAPLPVSTLTRITPTQTPTVITSGESTTVSLRSRQRLPPDTVRAFEEVFKINKRPPLNVITDLATAHNVDVSKARVWFNNRKAKEKRIDARERHNGSDERRRSNEVSPTGSSPSPGSVHPGGSNSSQSHAASTSGGGNGLAASSPNQPFSSMNKRFATMPVVPAACHVLTTESNVKFNIDELPAQVTVEMFCAMRERILQLERHIAEMSTNTAVMAAAAAAAAVRNGAVVGGVKRPSTDVTGASEAKRLKDRAALVQSIMTRILGNLHAETQKRKFMSLEDMLEIPTQETMCDQDFVAFFDEKGGIPSVLPGQQMPNGETVCPMISVNFCERAVKNLFGESVAQIPATAMIGSTETPINCRVRSMSVLYNRLSRMVNIAFQVTPVICE